MCLAERMLLVCLQAIHLLLPFFKPLFPASTVPPSTSLQLFLTVHCSWVDLVGFFLPLLPTSKLCLAARAHMHAHTLKALQTAQAPFACVSSPQQNVLGATPTWPHGLLPRQLPCSEKEQNCFIHQFWLKSSC